MAYTIDNDCMIVIDSGAASAGTATGKTMSATGTEFTVTGGLGTKDILAAKALIESKNFIVDKILMNPINARDVMYLPMFQIALQYGEPVIQTGKIGTIWGMDVLISNVVPVGKAYILSTGPNLSAAYAPMGFFVIKRPLMTDVDIKKEFDSVDVTLTTRYSPVVLNGDAICIQKGLATS
jgi:hypothetical protein